MHTDFQSKTSRKRDLYEVNERRMDNLIDLVEKHTRTERHLEQYSRISSSTQIEHTNQIQHEREQEIDHLKDIITHGDTAEMSH